MEKESCLAYARRTFTGQALALIEKQISLFFDESAEICRTRYQVGDAVQLRKGTFMHGIFGELDNFDYTVSHGFVSADFTGTARPNKFFHSVGMWNLRGDIRLCDYIRSYSGFTIAYTVGRGPGAKLVTELIPYHGFDAFVDRINNDENIWTYWGDKTKEISFLPSLASEKRQIGFLLNMESDYAKELARADVFDRGMSADVLRYFVVESYLEKFMTEERTALTTDRESAVMFGLPIRLAEGVLVGRKLENDAAALVHIKESLPEVYICNLDGNVIVA